MIALLAVLAASWTGTIAPGDMSPAMHSRPSDVECYSRSGHRYNERYDDPAGPYFVSHDEHAVVGFDRATRTFYSFAGRSVVCRAWMEG